jgi:hypothetical protein
MEAHLWLHFETPIFRHNYFTLPFLVLWLVEETSVGSQIRIINLRVSFRLMKQEDFRVSA